MLEHRPGFRRISLDEAEDMRRRAAAWPGSRADFVRQEQRRFSVGAETIRRLLRGETHIRPGFGAEVHADPTSAPPPPADIEALLQAQAAAAAASFSEDSGAAAVDLFKQGKI